jgi:hypothetical protein
MKVSKLLLIIVLLGAIFAVQATTVKDDGETQTENTVSSNYSGETNYGGENNYSGESNYGGGNYGAPNGDEEEESNDG